MADTMALYEAKTAKKVYLYRNGTKNAQPKCMVVNNRQIRDFNYFLSRVTSGLHAPVAVRSIYTPSEGHRVKNLEDLQTGHYYVAGVGNENFKKIKYGTDLLKSPTRKPRHDFFLPQRSQQTLSLTAPAAPRYKLPDKPFVIHVFRNGDERYRGARVLLSRRIMGSWEHVLELVTEKAGLITPAKRICTLDGRAIHAVSEIQDGGKYVALEGSKSFQKVAYCAIDERKAWVSKTKAIVRLRHKSDTLTGSETTDGAQSDSSMRTRAQPAAAATHPRRRKKSIRPMAGRKNKEGRERAIRDHREDSIFGGSPRDFGESGLKMPTPPLVKSSMTSFHMAAPTEGGDQGGPSDPHMNSSLEDPFTDSELHQGKEVDETKTGTSPAGKAKAGGGGGGVAGEQVSTGTPPPAVTGRAAGGSKGEPFHAPLSSTPKAESTEYVEEPQDGVFKAKTQARETVGAETILEGGETEVERPIDQEEAQEVEEEDTTGLDQSKNAPANLSTQEDRHSSRAPSNRSSRSPSNRASQVPSNRASRAPSNRASHAPSNNPSQVPSNRASQAPSNRASRTPSNRASPGGTVTPAPAATTSKPHSGHSSKASHHATPSNRTSHAATPTPAGGTAADIIEDHTEEARGNASVTPAGEATTPIPEAIEESLEQT